MLDFGSVEHKEMIETTTCSSIHDSLSITKLEKTQPGTQKPTTFWMDGNCETPIFH